MDTNIFMRELAKHRDLSVNKLMEELATNSLAEYDAENRFHTLAAQGSVATGLSLLDKLDAGFRLEKGQPPQSGAPGS